MLKLNRCCLALQTKFSLPPTEHILLNVNRCKGTLLPSPLSGLSHCRPAPRQGYPATSVPPSRPVPCQGYPAANQPTVQPPSGLSRPVPRHAFPPTITFPTLPPTMTSPTLHPRLVCPPLRDGLQLVHCPLLQCVRRQLLESPTRYISNSSPPSVHHPLRDGPLPPRRWGGLGLHLSTAPVAGFTSSHVCCISSHVCCTSSHVCISSYSRHQGSI